MVRLISMRNKNFLLRPGTSKAPTLFKILKFWELFSLGPLPSGPASLSSFSASLGSASRSASLL